jgi:hypothetical protein
MRISFLRKVLEHWLYSNGFSSEWVKPCDFSSLLLLNVLEHMLLLNGREVE